MNTHNKKLSVILVVLVFFLFAVGSGSSESKTESTKVDANEVENNTASEGSQKKSDSFEYEISNVIHDEYDASFGLGKMFKVFVEITNTGDVPVYMDDCVIDYEDNDGHLLHTYNYMSKVPDVVEPGEKGYFYGSGSFDDGIDFSNGCVLAPTVTIKKATGTLKSYDVEDVTIFDGKYGGVGVRGRIINNTEDDVSYIYVTTVFFDANGDVLGISGTSVTDVRANAKTSFEDSGMLSGDFSLSDVASYKIYCDEMYFQF